MSEQRSAKKRKLYYDLEGPQTSNEAISYNISSENDNSFPPWTNPPPNDYDTVKKIIFSDGFCNILQDYPNTPLVPESRDQRQQALAPPSGGKAYLLILPLIRLELSSNFEIDSKFGLTFLI